MPVRHVKNRALQTYLETHSEYYMLVQFWSSLNKEDCNSIKQDQTQLFPTTHCLQSSLRQRYAWRSRISFTKCEGCLVVRRGHGPQAEVAQGVGPGPLVELWEEHLEGLEGEQWDEVEDRRRVKRNQPQRNAQVHMHGWDDACKADLSHRCDVTQLCINEQRAVCSVLRVVHVHVRDSVYVVHRVWLKVDVVVAIICNLT